MKKVVKSFFTIALALVFCFSQLRATIYALSSDQKTQQTRGSRYFNVASCDTSGGSSGGGGTVSTTGETTDPPSAVKKVVWDTLTAGGIDDTHAAAIMGSIDNEGGWDPMSTGYFPNNFDSKDPSNPTAVRDGYGLIGWTPGTNLTEDMGKLGLKGEKPYTAETQAKVILGYIQKENKTGRYSDSDISAFLGAKTLSEASNIWLTHFEKPSDTGPAEQQDRLNSAQKILRQFGGSGPSTPGVSSSGSSAPCCPVSGSSGGTTTLTGGSEEDQVFNYFYSTKGLKLVQVAAIMGNLSIESGFSPTIYNVDHHTNDPKKAAPYAWGLVQWLPPDKVLGEQTKSGVKGNIYDLAVQLDIVWWEMKNSAPAAGAGFMGGFNQFKNQSQLADAVTYWQKDFEGSLGQADAERQQAAQEIYNKHQGDVPSASSGSGGSTTTASGSCSCPASPASGSGTIVLDPGHSTFSDTSSKNSLTGLYDTDTTGGPNEMHNAWVAANKIKKILEGKGYTVALTKKSEDESINLSQRADRANKTNGSLLFTIHADANVRWLAYPDSKSRRVPNDGSRKDGTDGLVHPDIEGPSKDFAEKMAPIIAKGISKGGDSYDATSFNDYYGSNGLIGNGLNPGNTPVQTILSSIPEVYSEVSPSDLPSDAFAKAAAEAISTVVKPSGGGAADAPASTGCTAGGDPGNLLDTVKKYAWPDTKNKGDPGDINNQDYNPSQPKPEYKQAYDNAVAQGQYGGGGYTDCGAFVTRAMIDSGYEPNYNYGGKGGPTGTQEAWLKANWQKVNFTSTKDLQPGDVAIINSPGIAHTYMYVGHIDNFDGDFAGASLHGHVPVAEGSWIPDSFNWYRRL